MDRGGGRRDAGRVLTLTTARNPHRVCLSTARYPPAQGGVSVAAERLARGLAAAGYDVHVVTSVVRAGARGEVERTVEDGVQVHRVMHGEPYSWREFFALRQCVMRLDRESPFALFHGFFLPAAAPCVDIANRKDRLRPLIASARGSDVTVLLEQPLSRWWLLPVLRQATWITSVNEEALRRVALEVAIDGRCSVIRNSVEQRTPAASRWTLALDNRGIVGTVGEFRKVKDIPLLVRAYATLPPDRRRGLWLAGYFNDAEEQAWCETLIDELGLARETTVTGPFPHDEVGDHLSRLHVFVLSSAHEGLPNALLEAAERGVPIVATAVGGMQEILEDGESALLVPHGDRDQLGRAIRRVLEDDRLARRLSEGARALAKRLSPVRERDAWLDLYRRLIEGTDAAAAT